MCSFLKAAQKVSMIALWNARLRVYYVNNFLMLIERLYEAQERLCFSAEDKLYFEFRKKLSRCVFPLGLIC